jgi:tetratricopeptide (TPR) repeat protein
MARNFSGAREIFDRFAHADVNARLMRGACRLFTGELRAALEDFSAIYHADAQALTSPGVLRYALGFYIYTLAKSGAVRLARERAHALDELSLTRYVSPMVRAVAHIGLGERDRAIALIEQARRRFDPWAAYLHVDPLLDELRADPRFADVAAA